MAQLPTREDLGPRPIAEGTRGPIASYQGGAVNRALQNVGGAISDITDQIQAHTDDLARENAALAEARANNELLAGKQDIEQRISSGEFQAQKPIDDIYGSLYTSVLQKYLPSVDPKYRARVQVALEGTAIRHQGDFRTSLLSSQQDQQLANLNSLAEEKIRYAGNGGDIDEASKELQLMYKTMGPQAGLNSVQIQSAQQKSMDTLFYNDAERRLQLDQNDLVGLNRLQHHLTAPDGVYTNTIPTAERLALNQRAENQKEQLIAKDAQQVKTFLSSTNAAAIDGVETPVDSKVFDKLPDIERASAKAEYDASQVSARAIKSTRTTTPAQDVELLKSVTPTVGGPDYQLQDQRRRAAILAIQAKQQALKDDPAGYTFSNVPSVKDAYDGLSKATTVDEIIAANTRYAEEQLAAQQRLGAPVKRILTDGQIEQLKNTFFDQKTGGLKAADAVIQEKARWGVYWPQVQTELFRDAKLPNSVRVITTGVPRQSAEILARLSNEDPVALKKAAIREPGVEQQLDSVINSNLENFRIATANQPGGTKLYEAFLDQGRLIAYDELRKGKNYSDAANTAYSVLLQDVGGHERYNFSSDNSFLAPVKVGNIDALETGAEKVVDGLRLDGIDPVKSALPIELREGDVLPYVKREAKWISEPGERGLVLYVNGRALIDKQGNAITRTWNELLGRPDNSLATGKIERPAKDTAAPSAGSPAGLATQPTESRTVLGKTPPLSSNATSKDSFSRSNTTPSLVSVPLVDRRALPHDAPILDEYAGYVERAKGLPENVLVALKNAGERSESIGKRSTSSQGARGIMQFIASTAKEYGLNDPSDPLASLDKAGAFFSDILSLYQGNLPAAIAYYNGGKKAGDAVAEGKQPPRKETQSYLARVLAELQRLGTSTTTTTASDNAH